MLKLTYAKYGSTGALRCYQHPNFGLIETVTTWREPGAYIIRIETERDRAKWREMSERLHQRPVQPGKGRSKAMVRTACAERGGT